MGPKPVYRREDYIVEGIAELAALSERLRTGAGGLPGHLRDPGLVVVCGPEGVEVRSGMS
jgi:hypothetical protein